MKVNKYILRGILFAGLSLALAVYEALLQDEPRFEIILGYSLVFLYGILIIVTRKKRPDYQDTDLQSEE